jgi:hypothetical protein
VQNRLRREERPMQRLLLAALPEAAWINMPPSRDDEPHH